MGHGRDSLHARRASRCHFGDNRSMVAQAIFFECRPHVHCRRSSCDGPSENRVRLPEYPIRYHFRRAQETPPRRTLQARHVHDSRRASEVWNHACAGCGEEEAQARSRTWLPDQVEGQNPIHRQLEEQQALFRLHLSHVPPRSPRPHLRSPKSSRQAASCIFSNSRRIRNRDAHLPRHLRNSRLVLLGTTIRWYVYS